MFEKIKPLHDRVLVKRVEMEENTPAGLIIPDTAKERPQMGKVVSTGPGKVTAEGKLISPAVKRDDVIYFGKYAGTEAGDDYLIIREDEILGILEK